MAGNEPTDTEALLAEAKKRNTYPHWVNGHGSDGILIRDLADALTKAEERWENGRALWEAMEATVAKARTDALEEAAVRYEAEAEKALELADKYTGYYRVRSAYQQAATIARALAPGECTGASTCPAPEHIEGCFATDPYYQRGPETKP